MNKNTTLFYLFVILTFLFSLFLLPLIVFFRRLFIVVAFFDCASFFQLLCSLAFSHRYSRFFVIELFLVAVLAAFNSLFLLLFSRRPCYLFYVVIFLLHFLCRCSHCLTSLLLFTLVVTLSTLIVYFLSTIFHYSCSTIAK